MKIRSQQSIPSRYALKAGKHPFGIKPLGNKYFDSIDNSQFEDTRTIGLGNLSIFTDEILNLIFSHLSGKDLARLAIVSKAMYCWSHNDDPWKQLCLLSYPNFRWHGSSWRETFAFNHSSGQTTTASNGINVENFYSDFLFQSWFCAAIDILPEWLSNDNIDRVTKEYSREDFLNNYEIPNKPVLIKGGALSWNACKLWNEEYLCKRYGKLIFRAEAMDTSLENYFNYAKNTREETPMYLFDKFFAQNCPDMLDDYHVPCYFQEDLFSLLPQSQRPDFRWIIMGPEKSGSSFHKDPNGTSAWNATITGRKKWLLYPPDFTPPGVLPSADGSEVTTPSSIIEWFVYYYRESQKTVVKPVECITEPGDIIFVPSGWWHTVINLETTTIAITQNYVSHSNLDNVLGFIRDKKDQISGLLQCEDAEKLAERFENAYELKYPGKLEKRLPDKETGVSDSNNINVKRQCFWKSLVSDSSQQKENNNGSLFNFTVNQ